MIINNQKLSSNNFLEKVITSTNRALKVGALRSIDTNFEIIEDKGVNFIIRIVDNLSRKDNAKKAQKKTDKSFNPFLPYEQNLFVSDLSQTHVCILNKFNVVPNHLLLITRDFESQENFLNLDDFMAIAQVFQEIDGFAFYNSGKLSGASQPHKHLQFIPFASISPNHILPISQLIINSKTSEIITHIPEFPFILAIAYYTFNVNKSIIEMAEILLNLYNQLLKKININHNSKKCLQPYNLLITKQWIFIIPRQQESAYSININALGFGGNLLVKNQQEYETILKYKPMDILAKVAQKK